MDGIYKIDRIIKKGEKGLKGGKGEKGKKSGKGWAIAKKKELNNWQELADYGILLRHSH